MHTFKENSRRIRNITHSKERKINIYHGGLKLNAATCTHTHGPCRLHVKAAQNTRTLHRPQHKTCHAGIHNWSKSLPRSNLKSPASVAYLNSQLGRFIPVASITRDRLRRPQVQVGGLMPLPGKEFGHVDNAACT